MNEWINGIVTSLDRLQSELILPYRKKSIFLDPDILGDFLLLFFACWLYHMIFFLLNINKQ